MSNDTTSAGIMSADNMSAESWRTPTEYYFDGVKMLRTAQPRAAAQNAKDFNFRNDDILIASYPKSGTTWTQMMTYLVRNGADIEEANSKPLWERARFLENQDPNQELSGAQLAENDPSPRLLKTHLPEHIMRRSVAEGKPRVIVVMRNPKDTLSSFYHWHKNMPFLPTPISWDEFFKQYQRKELFYGDLMEWLVGWWGHRHDENFLFLQFEDMKRDPRSAVAKIAQHCHVTLTSEQLDTIAAHSDFRQMRASGAIKPLLAEFGVPVTDFLRKGEVGDWKNSFTPEQSAYADDQCAKRCDPVDLKFHYE